jgi:hypothetical protein
MGCFLLEDDSRAGSRNVKALDDGRGSRKKKIVSMCYPCNSAGFDGGC